MGKTSPRSPLGIRLRYGPFWKGHSDQLGHSLESNIFKQPEFPLQNFCHHICRCITCLKDWTSAEIRVCCLLTGTSEGLGARRDIFMLQLRLFHSFPSGNEVWPEGAFYCSVFHQTGNWQTADQSWEQTLCSCKREKQITTPTWYMLQKLVLRKLVLGDKMDWWIK